MTSPIESKYTVLRRNAIAFYEAVIFPQSPDVFDAINPRPRMALDIELARIEAKEQAEGLSIW